MKILEIINKYVKPIVSACEDAAKQGIIDKAGRKALAWQIINHLVSKGVIKLNFLTRLLIGFAIDYIAKKLPAFDLNTGKLIKGETE